MSLGDATKLLRRAASARTAPFCLAIAVGCVTPGDIEQPSAEPGSPAAEAAGDDLPQPAFECGTERGEDWFEAPTAELIATPAGIGRGDGDSAGATPPVGQPASYSSDRPLPVFLNHLEKTYYFASENYENARSDVSSRLPGRQTTVPGWTEVDEETWQSTVTCVRELLGPFRFEVVLEDPGTATDQIEVHIGGRPEVLEMGALVAGVAPQEKRHCSVVENPIVYVFPAVLQHDTRLVCETIVHEISHTFGVDHLRDCEDPMSYQRCAERRFRYRESRCGEGSDRPCICYDSHNSARMLLEGIGAGDRPALWIADLTSGGQIDEQPEVVAVTNLAPLSVTATIDGTPVGVTRARDGLDGSFRYRFTPFWELRAGSHEISVEAIFNDAVLQEQVSVLVPSLDDIRSSTGEEGMDVTGGCSAADRGSSSGSSPALLLWLCALVGAGRRLRTGRPARR